MIEGGERSALGGRLFVVATPLGNLSDFSPRACEVLSSVDVIACEDTRVTRKLLKRFEIETAATSFHEHNEESKTSRLIRRLEEGESVALVSDAGTPLLSDPGFHLVRTCREKSISVIPVPGPFAAAAAVSVSGLPTDRVIFVGFLPSKRSKQKENLAELAGLEMTLVFYLSPHRLDRTMEVLLDGLGDRRAFLIREMTKVYETSYYGTLSSLKANVDAEVHRGEFTLVVEGSSESRAADFDRIDLLAYVNGLIKTRGLSRKNAIKRAASDLDLPKREVYDLVVSSRGREQGDSK